MGYPLDLLLLAEKNVSLLTPAGSRLYLDAVLPRFRRLLGPAFEGFSSLKRKMIMTHRFKTGQLVKIVDPGTICHDHRVRVLEVRPGTRWAYRLDLRQISKALHEGPIWFEAKQLRGQP